MLAKVDVSRPVGTGSNDAVLEGVAAARVVEFVNNGVTMLLELLLGATGAVESGIGAVDSGISMLDNMDAKRPVGNGSNDAVLEVVAVARVVEFVKKGVATLLELLLIATGAVESGIGAVDSGTGAEFRRLESIDRIGAVGKGNQGAAVEDGVCTAVVEFV